MLKIYEDNMSKISQIYVQYETSTYPQIWRDAWVSRGHW